MLYNVVMFVPFGIIYCYYQKTFSIYKAIGLSFLTTFSIEAAQFILKTGVVDIDDLIVNTIGSLLGIFLYIALQKILQWKQLWNVHEVIDTIATILPPLFISIVVEMFFGDVSPTLCPVHTIVLTGYGVCDYILLIKDFSLKSKLLYAAFYIGIFWLILSIL
jgi:putative teicoplanin resistance protein